MPTRLASFLLASFSLASLSPAAAWRALMIIVLLIATPIAILIMSPQLYAADVEVIVKAIANHEPPRPAAIVPNTDHKRQQSLLSHMSLFHRQQEVINLTATLENGQADNFYGLFLNEESGIPQGGILILHDREQHGHWPNLIAPLREYLPRYGWATLTIELAPTPSQPHPGLRTHITPATAGLSEADSGLSTNDKAGTPSATEHADQEGSEKEQNISPDANDSTGLSVVEKMAPVDAANSSEGGDNTMQGEPALPRLSELPPLATPEQPSDDIGSAPLDPKARYLSRNRGRIVSAIDYLQQHGQFNLVIIGTGKGAAWAIDYVSQHLPAAKKGLTLITIDPIDHPDLEPLAQRMLAIDTPFLELISPHSNAPAWQQRKRRVTMRHAQQGHYQQIRLPALEDAQATENSATRRARGWLRTHAAGTLIKN